MEIREGFGSAEELLRRARGLSRQLRELDRGAWPRLRSRDDFDTIYWLPAWQRSRLERVYLDGRGLAAELSSLLSSCDDSSRPPTFESFVERVEGYAAEGPARLERTVAEARALLPELEDPPRTLQLMIDLAGRELDLAAQLDDWLRAVRRGRQRRPAPRPKAGRPARAPHPAAGAWARHRSAWIASLLAAAASGILAAVLL